MMPDMPDMTRQEQLEAWGKRRLRQEVGYLDDALTASLAQGERLTNQLRLVQGRFALVARRNTVLRQALHSAAKALRPVVGAIVDGDADKAEQAEAVSGIPIQDADGNLLGHGTVSPHTGHIVLNR